MEIERETSESAVGIEHSRSIRRGCFHSTLADNETAVTSAFEQASTVLRAYNTELHRYI